MVTVLLLPKVRNIHINWINKIKRYLIADRLIILPSKTEGISEIATDSKVSAVGTAIRLTMCC